MNIKKFVKTKKHIEILRPKKNELLAMAKMNVPCNFVFTKDGEIIDYITLGERTSKGQTNMIEVTTESSHEIIDYGKLFDLIEDKIQFGVLSIQIDKKVFFQKEPLIIMLADFNQNIVKTCVYTDYFDNKFLIENNTLPNGARDCLYYFEQNDSVLAFMKDGPKLLYGQFSSVEEIFLAK